MSELITTSRQGNVATITLNRPEKYNAFTPAMMAQWRDALLECKQDDAVNVVVITGAGKAFCSGGDIAAMGTDAGRVPANAKAMLTNSVHPVPLAIMEMDKPVIAAINGAAVGAGLDLALACDLRYAADTARMGESYLSVGLVPGAGGTWTLPRRVGVAKALELFWTGDLISADEAERIGIVNGVVAHAKLMDHVNAIAEKIANAPPMAVRMIKRAVYQGQSVDFRTSLDLISSHYGVIAATQDHAEAIAALREKRPGKFSGR